MQSLLQTTWPNYEIQVSNQVDKLKQVNLKTFGFSCFIWVNFSKKPQKQIDIIEKSKKSKSTM